MTAPDPAPAESGPVADLVADPVADPVAAPRPEDAGRLTVDEALAELDRAAPDVLAVESEYGFTFGGPAETGPGRPVAAAVCTNPTCGQRGRHVQILDDTVQPVHCGGCAAVLHCDHQPEISRYRDGTIGAPVEHTVTACTVCATELGRVSAALPPIDLASLPVALLDQPLS